MKKFLLNCKLFIKKHYKVLFIGLYLLILTLGFIPTNNVKNTYADNTLSNSSDIEYLPILDRSIFFINEYNYCSLTTGNGFVTDTNLELETNGFNCTLIGYLNGYNIVDINIQNTYVVQEFDFVSTSQIREVKVVYNDLIVPYADFIEWFNGFQISNFSSNYTLIYDSYMTVWYFENNSLVGERVNLGANMVGNDTITDNTIYNSISNYLDYTKTFLFNGQQYVYLEELVIDFTNVDYNAGFYFRMYRNPNVRFTENLTPLFVQGMFNKGYDIGYSIGELNGNNRPLAIILNIVEDFFTFEILPNFTFGTFLSLLLGVSGLIILLKMFLGG